VGPDGPPKTQGGPRGSSQNPAELRLSFGSSARGPAQDALKNISIRSPGLRSNFTEKPAHRADFGWLGWAGRWDSSDFGRLGVLTEYSTLADLHTVLKVVRRP
jgi:hypothetical protein